MADQNEQGNNDGHGDNYSNIEVTNSTGTAIGHNARARVTTHGIDGQELQHVFSQVNEIIERLDDSQCDKQRLKYTSADLQEELGKSEPDSGFIERCWEKLKDIAEMSSLLLPVIQRFIQHGQNI